MNALVAVTKEQPEDALVTGPAFYRASTDAAHICRDIVLATATNIQGRRYVQVEGWQAIAIAHGCAASSGNVVRHPDGSVSATGTVVRMDNGVVVSSAEGYVGADEPTWFGGTVTSYGKTKVLPKRPDYAIRAMAQTRAISRACRSAFAHVVVMMNAGLSTTPAEEMGGGDGHEPTPEPTRREPERHPFGRPRAALHEHLAEAHDRRSPHRRGCARDPFDDRAQSVGVVSPNLVVDRVKEGRDISARGPRLDRHSGIVAPAVALRHPPIRASRAHGDHQTLSRTIYR